MDRKNPIGIFDSGVGGLTVVKSLLEKMPSENFIYFGDTAHVPYGNKSPEQLFIYARQILAFLQQRNVKAVIVACGTHSSLTLPSLEKQCALPMLGVVKAGARAAARTSDNGRIGVLATHVTVSSLSYTKEIQAIGSSYRVFERACPRFVPLVESGSLSGPEIEDAIDEYVGPVLNEGIDTLILGCTHYPFLAPAIQDYVGEQVKLVDPSDETIEQMYAILAAARTLNDSPEPGRYEFYVSGQSSSFFTVGKRLIGDAIREVTRVDLE